MNKICSTHIQLSQTKLKTFFKIKDKCSELDWIASSQIYYNWIRLNQIKQKLTENWERRKSESKLRDSTKRKRDKDCGSEFNYPYHSMYWPAIEVGYYWNSMDYGSPKCKLDLAYSVPQCHSEIYTLHVTSLWFLSCCVLERNAHNLMFSFLVLWD